MERMSEQVSTRTWLAVPLLLLFLGNRQFEDDFLREGRGWNPSTPGARLTNVLHVELQETTSRL